MFSDVLSVLLASIGGLVVWWLQRLIKRLDGVSLLYHEMNTKVQVVQADHNAVLGAARQLSDHLTAQTNEVNSMRNEMRGYHSEMRDVMETVIPHLHDRIDDHHEHLQQLSPDSLETTESHRRGRGNGKG